MEFNATFLICAISFIVFVFIMNQILYKPVAKIVSEREEYIKNNEQKASDARNEADVLIKDREEKIQNANKEAGKLIFDKSNSAKEEKANLINNAQATFKENIENNKNLLLQEKAQANTNISSQVHEMASLIVAKFLKEGQ